MTSPFENSTMMELQGQHLHLHPLRAAFWAEANALLLADLHLGKATHFRRAGIPTPSEVEAANFDQLINLLLTFHPKRVLILGDLFHSDYNHIWEEWGRFVRQFHHISFELVPGNHDILRMEDYVQAGLKVHPVRYQEGPFLFTHEPLAAPIANVYILTGHIHPGARLHGTGKQYLRLPCFYFGEWQGILPAFGHFTGLADISINAGDKVYGITEEAVLLLQA